MIQGGGFEPGMKQKETQAPIKNEANNGLKELTVTLSPWHAPTTRTRRGAQFFINVKNNDFLNHSSPAAVGVTAFSARWSKVPTSSTKIKGVATGNTGFHQDVPKEDVIIERAEVC